LKDDGSDGFYLVLIITDWAVVQIKMAIIVACDRINVIDTGHSVFSTVSKKY